jgi:hypothetical protein
MAFNDLLENRRVRICSCIVIFTLSDRNPTWNNERGQRGKRGRERRERKGGEGSRGKGQEEKEREGKRQIGLID